MMQAPVTEEDRPAVESMIKRLKRLRKREHAQGKTWMSELDDAIAALMQYGELKEWWKDKSTF